MLTLIGRRLLTLIPILLLVSFGVFMLTSLLPGDPAITLAGGPNATPQAVAAIRERLHLDEPLVMQYLYWLGGAVRLDFGASLFSSVSVMDSIGERLPVTISLVVAAVIVALAIAVPLGVLAGARPGGIADKINRVTSTLGVGVPNFWFAAILIIIFAVTLQWLPPAGYIPLTTSPIGWLQSVALAAVALGFFLSAELSRQLRAALINELGSNHIRTMWAKGASARLTIVKHGLRNAAGPAITVFAVHVGYLLGGTVIIEQIFSFPGLGSYLLDGIVGGDLPVIQGVTMVFVLFQMAMSLLVDISYGLLNPKVRVS